jgi:hypothetical protein
MGKSTPLRPPGFHLICCTWFVLHNLYYAICGPSSPLNEEVFGIHFMLLRDRVPEMRHLHCQQELLELLECNRHQLHVISRLLHCPPSKHAPALLQICSRSSSQPTPPPYPDSNSPFNLYHNLHIHQPCFCAPHFPHSPSRPLGSR